MSKDKKNDAKTRVGSAGNIEKRFNLTVEERQEIQNLQSIIGIQQRILEGINDSIMLNIARIRRRIGIDENSPEGFQRVVNFDAVKYEMVITDLKIDKEKTAKMAAEIKAEEKEEKLVN